MRPMREEATDVPRIGAQRNCLGVRPGPGKDVKVDGEGVVEPVEEGLSVVPEPLENLKALPKPLRPYPYGECSLRVFEADVEQLSDDLRALQTSRAHALISPARRMSLDHYQTALASTQKLWRPIYLGETT